MKLPELSPQKERRPVSAADRALYVAAALAHQGVTYPNGNWVNTHFYLGRAALDWFDADPDAKAAFIAWYEAQP